MAEEDLKKAILDKIQREKEAILAQAKTRVDEILKRATEEALSLRKNYLRDVEKRCLVRKTKELSAITLKAKSQVLEAREQKISQALSLIKDEFKAIPRDKNRYKSIFKNLLIESLEGIRPQSLSRKTKLKIMVNPADKDLAVDVLKEIKLDDIEMEAAKSVDVGLELSDLEGDMIILNTFKSRLEKVWPELRQEVAKILFNQ